MTVDLEQLGRIHILVVGDVMLDRYVWGDVSRISPEAPVPIISIDERSEVLGGAGNAASNLAGLGCRVTVLSVCGRDEYGARLKTLFSEKNIDAVLLEDETRPTITKTRVMAQHQQLFRMDEEKKAPVSEDLETALGKKCEDLLDSCQGVILSDYGKGMFGSGGLSRAVIAACRQKNIPVFVDPKGKDWDRYAGATCVTPNTGELGLISRQEIGGDESRFLAAAGDVIAQYDFEWLLVTRGAKGMCLVDKEKNTTLISARAREVYDVSGAGDTVIATLCAGVSAGLSVKEAAELANTAAGVVVGKLGTQPIHKNELASALKMGADTDHNGYAKKILSLSAGVLQVQAYRAKGEKVVFTNGCYDLLHPGHIDLLHRSKHLGDRLVVGLNTDASIRRLKGEKRPILNENDRSAILSALGCVDLVILFDEDTPLNLIKALKPDVLVKGADYTPDKVVGRDEVLSWGGKVELVPLLEGHSTTGIVNKLMAT